MGMKSNPDQAPSGADQPTTDLTILLCSLQPVLHPDVYVFASLANGTEMPGVPLVATFREAKGTTVIVEESAARQVNLPLLFRAAWTTLTVPSDLNAVGLTAAVAAALRDANIPCNVVAAAFHDHLFVPADLAERALECLHTLQRQALERCLTP